MLLRWIIRQAGGERLLENKNLAWWRGRIVPVVISTSCPVVLEWHRAGTPVAGPLSGSLFMIYGIYLTRMLFEIKGI